MSERELNSLITEIDSLVEEYERKKIELDKEMRAKKSVKADLDLYDKAKAMFSYTSSEALKKYLETTENNIASIKTRLREIEDTISNSLKEQKEHTINSLTSIINNKSFDYEYIKDNFYTLNKIETFIKTHTKNIK